MLFNRKRKRYLKIITASWIILLVAMGLLIAFNIGLGQPRLLTTSISVLVIFDIVLSTLDLIERRRSGE